MSSFSLAEFFGDLAVVSATIAPDSNTSTSGVGSGVVRASFGTRMWRGSVSLPRVNLDRHDEIAAKLHYLQEADAVFRITPAHYVGGTRTTTTITAIDGSDRRIVTLGEQPADGELFDVVFDTDKRSLHRVVEHIGGTYQMRIVPALPLGAAVSDEVGRGRPEINAVVTSMNLGNLQAVLAGETAFEWSQIY